MFDAMKKPRPGSAAERAAAVEREKARERWRKQQAEAKEYREEKANRPVADMAKPDVAKQAANTAKAEGRVIFQYLDVVSVTTGSVVPMIGAFTTDEQGATKGKLGRTTGSRAVTSPIESIESVGWKLVDIGYVYQQTHAVSRDKFLASGQQEAYSGRVLGIYTFRREHEPTTG